MTLWQKCTLSVAFRRRTSRANRRAADQQDAEGPENPQRTPRHENDWPGGRNGDLRAHQVSGLCPGSSRTRSPRSLKLRLPKGAFPVACAAGLFYALPAVSLDRNGRVSSRSGEVFRNNPALRGTGEICTGKSITVPRWFDYYGVLSTPAAGTRYEVVGNSHGYYAFLNLNASTLKIQVVNNSVRRSWADSISTDGVEDQIIGNTVQDGQDEGITVNGTNQVVPIITSATKALRDVCLGFQFNVIVGGGEKGYHFGGVVAPWAVGRSA